MAMSLSRWLVRWQPEKSVTTDCHSICINAFLPFNTRLISRFESLLDRGPVPKRLIRRVLNGKNVTVAHRNIAEAKAIGLVVIR